MFAVIYDPTDGRILHTKATSPEAMREDPRPWLEVADYRADYDRTHHVVGGQVVAIGGDA